MASICTGAYNSPNLSRHKGHQTVDNAAEKHSFNFSRLHILEPSETNSDNFHTEKRNFIYFPVKAETRGSVCACKREREGIERRETFSLSRCCRYYPLRAESNTGARKEVTTSGRGQQTKQSKTRQSEARQGKARQGKTRQSKAGHEA